MKWVQETIYGVKITRRGHIRNNMIGRNHLLYRSIYWCYFSQPITFQDFYQGQV